MKQILATMILATAVVTLSNANAKLVHPVADPDTTPLGRPYFDDKGTPHLWGLKP